jgi:hypothetical protein
MAYISTTSPVPVPTAPVSAAQKVENTVFNFLQAHYAKLVAAVVGFAASHFGLIEKLFGKLL